MKFCAWKKRKIGKKKAFTAKKKNTELFCSMIILVQPEIWRFPWHLIHSAILHRSGFGLCCRSWRSLAFKWFWRHIKLFYYTIWPFNSIIMAFNLSSFLWWWFCWWPWLSNLVLELLVAYRWSIDCHFQVLGKFIALFNLLRFWYFLSSDTASFNLFRFPCAGIIFVSNGEFLKTTYYFTSTQLQSVAIYNSLGL